MNEIPDFEALVALFQSLDYDDSVEAVHVVCGARSGESKFIPVGGSTESSLREGLRGAFERGLRPIGLLGWKQESYGWQPNKGLFPWIERTSEWEELFDRLCEEGANSVTRHADDYSANKSD